MSLKNPKKIIPWDYLQNYVLARYMEHQDCFYLYSEKELIKKIELYR